MNFKDHFSNHAGLYAKARPHYPEALFDWIARTAPSRGCAWDAGCGNGQASVALAQRFARVIATDPSARQLGNAVAHPRIEYRNEPRNFSAQNGGGYRTSIDARSIDASVAQATRPAPRGRSVGGAWAASGRDDGALASRSASDQGSPRTGAS